MHSKYVSSSSSGVIESKKASSMERNSLMSSSLRDHSVRGCSSTNKIMMVKDPIRNCNSTQQSQYCGGEDYNNVGFSWPPRCYACSFCKREFRSAQALGGHMNVHRRDRARLRQSPPLSPQDHHHHPVLNLNFSPNPNPNFSTFSSPSPSTFTGSLPCLVSPPALSSPPTPPAPPAPDLNKWIVDGSPLHSLSTQRAVKKSKFLKASAGLSLEIGQVSHSKADLDLELRLGYP